MPPAVDASDEESVGSEIPYNKKSQAEKTEAEGQLDEELQDNVKAEGQEEEEYEEGDEDSEGEGMYVVEDIVDHRWENGNLVFQVKWKGYPNFEDQTMEPEENLLSAKDILTKYYKRNGGRAAVHEPPPKEQAKNGKGGKKRKSNGEATPTPEPSKKRKSRGVDTPENGDTPDWVPKRKKWEEQIEIIDTIERDKSGNLFVFMHWKNGKKTKVNIEQCYDKCPMKMLKFYEQHLVFKDTVE